MHHIKVTQKTNWQGVFAIAEAETVKIEFKEGPPLIVVPFADYMEMCAARGLDLFGNPFPKSDASKAVDKEATDSSYRKTLIEIVGLEQRTRDYALSEPVNASLIDEVFTKAHEVFGRADAAIEWLIERKKALGDMKPTQFMLTNEGAQQVLRLLGQNEHGLPV